MNDKPLSAEQVITQLGLVRHPEGGHFRETYRHAKEDGGRGDCTVIYYLLAAGERSAWHRIDAIEVWHWYAGAPLLLSVAGADGVATSFRLGNDLAIGCRPHAVVPPQAWQSAVSEGDWTLVGCTVSPAFRFEGFEMAPAGWSPASPD